MSTDNDNHVTEPEADNENYSRAKDLDKPTVIAFILAPTILIAIVLFSSHIFEQPTDSGLQESLKYINKKIKDSGPILPALAPEFSYCDGRWYANGPVGDEELKNTCDGQKIEALEVKFAEITSAGLRYLRDEPIRTLILHHTQFSAESAFEISQLSQMTELDVYDCPGLDDETISHFTGPASLVNIRLRGGFYSDKAIEHLSTVYKNLLSLDLEKTKGVTDAVFGSVMKFPMVRSLCLSATSVTPSALVKAAKRLRLMNLSCGGLGIADKEVLALSKLPFTSMDFSDSPEITDLSLEYLAKCKSLTFLEIVKCPSISKRGVELFKKTSPKCLVKLTHR